MQRTSLRKARLYDQYRLPYAADAVVALLERIGPVNSVADIGAGTGQLTRLFAPHCRQVIAIEPDPAMRTVAGESLAGLTSAHIVAGSAEQTSLASASIELLVIGNAFHRFPAGACDELRRVLAPQGHVALFHYVLPTPLTDMLFSKLATLEGLSSRTRTAWPRLPLSALFGHIKLESITMEQEITQDWDAYFSSACSGIEAPEPGEAEYDRFAEINREVFDAFSISGSMCLNYETQVTFAMLRSGATRKKKPHHRRG